MSQTTLLAATPQADKMAPEAVALREPRPVTRLNRRTLAILAGGLSVGVMGALIWSLQPQQRGAGESTELYNVDRVSRSEGLDQLPADYSKLPALPPDVPELGPPLPGDLGPPSSIRSSRSPPPMPRPATTPTMRCTRKQKRRQLQRCSSAPAPAGRARGAVASRCRAGLRRQCRFRSTGRWPGLDGGPAC